MTLLIGNRVEIYEQYSGGQTVVEVRQCKKRIMLFYSVSVLEQNGTNLSGDRRLLGLRQNAWHFAFQVMTGL